MDEFWTFPSTAKASYVEPKVPKKELEIIKVINLINTENRILVILRGLPGSGKSTLAKRILKDTIGYNVSAANAHILSTDDYFSRNGSYNYQLNELQSAHVWNQNRAYKAMSRGFSPVIIDNTNIESWEMKPYLAMGTEQGYVIELLEPPTRWLFNESELTKRNLHGISRQKIKQLIDRYERNLTVPKLLTRFNLTYKNPKPPILRLYPPPDNSGQPQRASNASIRAPPQYSSYDVRRGNFEANYTSNSQNFSEVTTLRNNRWNNGAVMGVFEPIYASNYPNTARTAKPRIFHSNFESNTARSEAMTASNYITDFQQSDPRIEATCETGNESNDVILSDIEGNICPTEVTVPKQQNGPILTDLSAWGLTDQALRSWDLFTPITDNGNTNNDRVIDTEQPVLIKDFSNACIGTDDTENFVCFLTTVSRDINRGNAAPHPVRVPSMLDKSCMTDEISDNYDLQLSHLSGMFPDIPVDKLASWLEKSNGDVDWAVEMLLSVSEEQAMNVDYFDCPIPIRSSSSSSSIDNNSQPIETNQSSGKKKKKRNRKKKKNGSNDDLQRDIERKIDISDEHYSSTLLKVKQKRFESKNNDEEDYLYPGTKIITVSSNGESNNDVIDISMDIDDNTTCPVKKKSSEMAVLDPNSDSDNAVSDVNEFMNKAIDNTKSRNNSITDDEDSNVDMIQFENIIDCPDNWKNNDAATELGGNLLGSLNRKTSTTSNLLDMMKKQFTHPVSNNKEPTNSKIGGFIMKHFTQQNTVRNKKLATDAESDQTIVSGTKTGKNPNIFSRLLSHSHDEITTSDQDNMKNTVDPTQKKQNNMFMRLFSTSNATDQVKKNNEQFRHETTTLDCATDEVKASSTNLCRSVNYESNIQSGSLKHGVQASTTGYSAAKDDFVYFDDDSDIEFDDLADVGEVQPTETIEMNLGEMFVEQLESKFGDASLIYPKGFQPVIQMPVTLAKQLYAFYVESVFQQMEAQNTVMDELVQEDEEFARKLEHELETVGEASKDEPKLDVIMREQARQRWAEREQLAELQDLNPETIAMRLTQDKLFKAFPHIENRVILEILQVHQYNYDDTVETLLANSSSEQLGQSPKQIREPPIDERLVIDMKNEHDDYLNARKTFNSGESNNQSARAHRDTASKYLAKRTLLYYKAQHYQQKRMPAVALYYSSLAAKQTELYDRANNLAAMCLLDYHSERLGDINTLDLHYLYVKEAVEALDLFVDKHISTLRSNFADNRQNVYLQVITGRGRRSEHGRPKIRPAVKNRLGQRNIPVQLLNPGLLKIKINKGTLLTSELS